jgi:hypothetical protein
MNPFEGAFQKTQKPTHAGLTGELGRLLAIRGLAPL